MIEGKKVALVGPASYMKDKNLGKEIDCFDLVIKVNNVYKLKENNSKDYGERIDILYHCLHSGAGEFRYDLLYGIKKIVCTYPTINPFLQDIISFNEKNYLGKLGKQVKFSTVSVGLYRDIEGKINSRPTSGLMMVSDVLNKGAREVHLYGLTMGLGGYDQSYPFSPTEEELREIYSKSITSNHDIDKQLKLFKNFLSLKNVYTDQYFNKLFKQKIMEKQ